MVQRRYSLDFDDQELLPPWERFHICNNIIGGLPIYVEGVEGNSAVLSRDYLVPHAEEGGALAPRIRTLASLQGSPQDLMHGDQGTHVPLLRRCVTIETQGGSREKTQHLEMRSTHPCSWLEDDAPNRVIVLCSTSMDRLVHPSMQSPLEDDVSLHGDILPGGPLDHQLMGDASHVGAPLIFFRGVETLGDNFTSAESLG